MSNIHKYFPVDSLPTKNIIYVSHIPSISSGLSVPSSVPSVEDLACNRISIRSSCRGSLQIATEPYGADIYIYEENHGDHGDYILRDVKTGTMIDPSIITDIECTSSTRSNRFKLTFPGYVPIEGILDITDGTIYQLYMIMERSAVTETMGGDFLIPALAVGSLIFFLLGEDNKKRKRFEFREKYKDIY